MKWLKNLFSNKKKTLVDNIMPQSNEEFSLDMKKGLLSKLIIDLRKITIVWVARPDTDELSISPSIHFMHKDHVDRFIEACIRLHVDPGINPFNKNKTARIDYITIGSPNIRYYWWSTPDLKKNNDENGAGIIDFFDFTTVWRRNKEGVETH